ncbi:hypothetical protein BDM02DRAFT_3120405 [Thelephora ganbajun]|uniref:Uncharacterized protein n=1 Tax=Thelephora ganbajun TaxID=370292 RepID=A0ACB6Z847_THEGA|nr:hypothetical protein BDM02DRAFT_3120405 [Thelephora ganbajun]
MNSRLLLLSSSADLIRGFWLYQLCAHPSTRPAGLQVESWYHKPDPPAHMCLDSYISISGLSLLHATATEIVGCGTHTSIITNLVSISISSLTEYPPAHACFVLSAMSTLHFLSPSC